MLVLGISDLEHDTAAALLGRDGLIAAIEEEKLSRWSRSSGIPRLAVDHCLMEAAASASDVSAIAVASRPKRAWLRNEGLRLSNLVARHRSCFPPGIPQSLFWKLNELRTLRRAFAGQIPLLDFEHHACHAASAFYPSAFDRALVLTMDESGDMWSGLVALGEGKDFHHLCPMRFPNSLGWFYSQVTKLLGFRAGRDEHKLQWLSKEGSPEFIAVFRKLFSKNSDGLPTLNVRYFTNGLNGSAAFSAQLCRELQISKSFSPRQDTHGAAIARSAQNLLEEMVSDLAESYRKKTGAKYLCVAGGVFLNVLLIRALETQTGFEEVFVQPVSGNPGSALGAAYLAHRQLQGTISREPLSHLYWGPQFEGEKVKAILDDCKAIYRYLPSDRELFEETVQLLQKDKIVAWYQGRLEFGHRALGNRSILASPFSPYVMENLNQYVKHREDFHPFALSIPAEAAPALFDCTENCQFMSSVGTLKGAAQGFERFAFNGQTIRVHTVKREVNSRFWNLLWKYGERAPAPVLVNTSFNLFGEPLVCDPREALRSFYSSGIDALVMGNFMVTKP